MAAERVKLSPALGKNEWIRERAGRYEGGREEDTRAEGLE